MAFQGQRLGQNYAVFLEDFFPHLFQAHMFVYCFYYSFFSANFSRQYGMTIPLFCSIAKRNINPIHDLVFLRSSYTLAVYVQYMCVCVYNNYIYYI